jgi:hypothetical protein
MNPTLVRRVDVLETRVSSYDRLSSLLVALIVTVGFLVVALIMIWLGSSASPGIHRPDGVTLPPYPDVTDGTLVDDDVAADVAEPSNKTDAELQVAVESVQTAVSRIAAHQQTGGKVDGKNGKGLGDGTREPGPTPAPPNFVPDYSRWKLTYKVDNLAAYKELLDGLGIQIGVVHPTEDIIARIGNVSTKPIVISSNRERETKTLRFSHSRPRLKRWDISIARKAGVNFLSDDVPIVQFFSEDLRTRIRLAELEFLNSMGRELEDVLRTNIRIEKVSGEFQFVVTSCDFE